MSNPPRIFVATPRLRLYGVAVAAAHAMFRAYGGAVEWLQLENDQPYPCHGPEGNQNVLHNYAVARQRFLTSDCTHLLTLEDDMVPQPDVLTRLVAAASPVAYSLYCWRRPPYHWSAYRTLHETDGISWSDHNPWEAQRLAQADAVIEVAGVGLGCTLIDRATVATLPFRCPYGIGGANDWYFALDCQQAGLRQVAVLGARCGHITPEPSLRILWPDPDADGHAVAGKRLWKAELL
jgi:hypothetical protein